MNKNDIRPYEHNIQSAFFEWCRNPLTIKKYPKLEWIHAIPNGGARHIAVATKMRKEGVKKGILDVCLPCYGRYAGKVYTTLRIEFKRPKEKLTNEQKEFIEFCESEGAMCIVCTDAEEAISVVKGYLS